jgi:hypothetical protein
MPLPKKHCNVYTHKCSLSQLSVTLDFFIPLNENAKAPTASSKTTIPGFNHMLLESFVAI